MSRRRGSEPARAAGGGAALGVAAVLLAGWPAAAGEDARPLTEAEARGRRIYLTGESASGSPITALFGAERFELLSTSATCGSCHGNDGSGRPESGVIPPDITWEQLTKTYGHRHGDGATHAPFDAESLARYLRSGSYPGGRPGDPAMPVYAMDDGDLGDLVAYLRRLGHEPVPGLTEASIRIGTLVPAAGPLVETGRVIADTLSALFREINAQGGIFGREVVLRVGRVAARGDAAEGEVRAWLSAEQPLLVVATFTPGAERAVGSAIDEQGIPLIAPVTLYPVEEYARNRHSFFLYPGLAVQGRALVRFAAQPGGGPERRLAVVFPELDASSEVVAAIAEESSRQGGWAEPRRVAFPPEGSRQDELAHTLRAAGVDTVLHLGAEAELRAFLAAAAAESWTPTVLASGMLAGPIADGLPGSFSGRLCLAYPTLPRDRQPRALEQLDRLADAGGASPVSLQARIATAAAAKLAAEALRRSGRASSREKVEAELERLYRFETGLTPPITYTRNRRQGVNGAYVVSFGSVAGEPGAGSTRAQWVELE